MRPTFYNAIFVIVLAHIVLPIVILLWLWLGKSSSRFSCLVKILITAPYILLIFLSGYWQQLSYYSRFILILFYIAAAIKSLVKSRKLPMYKRMVYIDWLFIYGGFIISIVISLYIINIFRAYYCPDTAPDLAFPFKKGVYMVSFGGNGDISPLLNYHYRIPLYSRAGLDPSVIYAVDIVKLNSAGKSSSGILPLENRRYEIFKENVYSPCSGKIAYTEDKWPNERPFAYNYPYNPGNNIVIKSTGFYVLLGHLDRGSLLVKTGDSVEKGQLIARVGNSGWTTEPHLHIQVMSGYSGSDKDGDGLPFLFESRYPAKNTLFIK